MKTKLLFEKQNSNAFYILLAFCLCFNFGWSQNLTLNSTMGEYNADLGFDDAAGNSNNYNDNSDAWDMSPPSTVQTDSDFLANTDPVTTTTSPYRTVWNNSDLDSWLNTNCGDSNEAPGSSSDGNFDYSAGSTMGVPTRGVKINEACRRLYQKVAVTSGISYTLIMDSRTEADNVDTEVFILNTEIADEVGLSSASTTVDDYLLIDNNFNASKSNATTNNFTKSTLEFTPSGSFIVIYVRASDAIDDTKEVFFDNIELYETSTLSTKEVLATDFKIYPNPADDYITVQSKNIKISSIDMYSVLGKQVLSKRELTDNRINVSTLSKGVYFMKINAEDGSVTKKVIID